MPSATRESHFKTIQQFKPDYAPASISQYVSGRTGMQVVVVDQKGPKVHGYFALATEIFDDSGSPHTLEHLCFMGSKSYQYKGVLDKLATRAYSNTNAWTATDHTAYTLDTAGWEGFAQILPVYLEHVIVPTITDEGCITEVHHVDGDGNDAGVVYSEMQGVQNTGPELMDLAARRLLYPEGIGFRYETGGMMEQLRVLTPERIRAFHKEMYQPKNLCLVITGEVDHENLLHILDDFEETILEDIPAPGQSFKRPWVESPQPKPLTQTVVKTVEFPEEDESSGDILIGFLGPDCKDSVQSAALNVLLTYLAGSSVSILENVMVEKEQLASAVSYWWDSRPDTLIWFQPSSVATEKLEQVEKRLFELLNQVANEPLDMNYLTDCLKRELRTIKFDAETSTSTFANAIINDFLFGERDGSTLRDLESTKEYEELASWSDHDWRGFMKKWMVDAHHISILGVPSKALAEKTKTEEISRIAARKEKLGDEGLKKLAEILEDAKTKNDKEIPKSLLEKWPVPGVDSIHFIGTLTARAGLARDLGVPDNDAQMLINSEKDVPIFIQFEQIPSNFAHITLLIGTQSVPVEQRPLISLLLDNFFNTPITRDGQRIEFEQVVTELEKDTISYEARGGRNVGDPEGLAISLQVEPDKYGKAIEWIKTMSSQVIFDETRLNAAMTRMLAEVPMMKRDGNSMLYAVDASIHLAKESNTRARNTLVRGVYMKRLKKLLARDPQSVIKSLEKVRDALFTPDNYRVLVIADISKLSQPVQSWALLAAGGSGDEGAPSKVQPIVRQSERLSEHGRHPGAMGVTIVPMTTLDSSYCLSSSRGPAAYTDARLPALMVAVAFLDAVEGPLWAAVRGTGLAYGTGFSRDVGDGLVQFRVYRSPDARKAFAAARDVVAGFVAGSTAFERHALEGAVSSIVVLMADEQPTMASAAQMSFVTGVVRGLSEDYNASLLKRVREVGVDEIKAAMKELLLPVFTPREANIIVTCAPIMEENLEVGFAEEGFTTTCVRPLKDFQDDYGLTTGDDDEDDEEGDEEGDDDDDDDGDTGSESDDVP